MKYLLVLGPVASFVGTWVLASPPDFLWKDICGAIAVAIYAVLLLLMYLLAPCSWKTKNKLLIALGISIVSIVIVVGWNHLRIRSHTQRPTKQVVGTAVLVKRS